MLPINTIYKIDCLEGMKLLDDNSVDSIITDPPYGLGFMGKEWDTFDKSQFGKAGEEERMI
jgi:DNA modification methylase